MIQHLIEVSFVASWWLMLIIICAMCFLMFLDRMGYNVFKKGDV